mmetsp:Transcript_25866/g.59556  ORF Transcript_25866/g.59556 Transcript_25866/m.59556 type:complete len:619 (-) Transcript_25866:21-1877(-)
MVPRPHMKKARICVTLVSNLLTDDNEGQSPEIPLAVMRCASPGAVWDLVSAVVSAARDHASSDPQGPASSPLLAATFLHFLARWGPAYLCPDPARYDPHTSNFEVLHLWPSGSPAAAAAAAFCAHLAAAHLASYPLEDTVAGAAVHLLSSLARADGVRPPLAAASPLRRLAGLHVAAAAGPAVDADMGLEAGPPLPAAVSGYLRVGVRGRGGILAALCRTLADPASEPALARCVDAAAAALTTLACVPRGSADPRVTDQVLSCIELYRGMVAAGDMRGGMERVPAWITPALPQLAALMGPHAHDLSVCEGLLRLFRDYAEGFAALLNGEGCAILLEGSRELLRLYSAHHVGARAEAAGSIRGNVSSAEEVAAEEQAYDDVLCAMQLLIHLGTRNFLDTICMDGTKQVATTQVTDVIFFGLSQILPLMTEGLFQFPKLRFQYFCLLDTMTETYPAQCRALPPDLALALSSSLHFGMKHPDPDVGRAALRGAAALLRESFAGDPPDPQPLEDLTPHFLADVVFGGGGIVWDRLEAAADLALALVAADCDRVVRHVGNTVLGAGAGERARDGISKALEEMVRPELLEGALRPGFAGRMSRVKFRQNFVAFVKKAHSFLFIK